MKGPILSFDLTEAYVHGVELRGGDSAVRVTLWLPLGKLSELVVGALVKSNLGYGGSPVEGRLKLSLPGNPDC